MRRALTLTTLAAACLVVGVLLGRQYVLDLISVPLPTFPAVAKRVWPDQNWSKDQRDFFHFAVQGSSTFGIPYEWFVALERPVLSISSPGLLSDAAYLDRLGFIASRSRTATLPIGFEHGGAMIDPTSGAHWTNPRTGTDMTMVGLTCAACHTGRMTYRGTEILIDGGGALIDVQALRRAMAISLYMTRYLPDRLERFTSRLLGDDAPAAAKARIRETLDGVLKGFAKVQALDKTIASRSVPEGIGRLDALNRIGNQLFSLGMGIDANYAPTSAPVRYPHIWEASWFDWVQYNASIQQPMIRNAGEALGLGVKIDLTGKPDELYRSTMDADTLYGIEETLRGPSAPSLATGWTGLRAPRWPEDILPPIDRGKAAKGEALYRQLCQACHLPATNTAAFYDQKYRQTFGPHALIVPYFSIDTDPAQATDMANRIVKSPPDLGLTTEKFGFALGQLVGKAVDHWYASRTPPVSPARQYVMNGELPNGIQAPIAYKAKPLDGVWSAAPYLHNGSVPTLYALLQPVSERPKRFTIGSREFDPVDVGLVSAPIRDGTVIDTTRRGDLNTGHAFDDPGKPGVIGRKLTEEERRDLVEYMKTL